MENFFEKHKRAIYIFIAFLFVLNIFAWQEVFYLSQNHNLKVSFLDVGQGDSAFIETPERHQILIDGGPSSAVVGKIAGRMPFWDRTLDLVILTHPEKDHMQGLLEVLKRYKVDNILWTGVYKNAPEYKEWINVLAKQKSLGAKIIIAKAGQEIKAGKVLIDILHPLESLSGKDPGKAMNDTCVVNKLIYGKNSFLFTGDISSAGEQVLTDSQNNNQSAYSHEYATLKFYDLKSDVLKVAHHGSKYSSSDLFLQNVLPSIAVISVGAKNTYGHPTPEAMQRITNVGAKILRTDQLGDIVISSDGQSISLLR